MSLVQSLRQCSYNVLHHSQPQHRFCQLHHSPGIRGGFLRHVHNISDPMCSNLSSQHYCNTVIGGSTGLGISRVEATFRNTKVLQNAASTREIPGPGGRHMDIQKRNFTRHLLPLCKTKSGTRADESNGHESDTDGDDHPALEVYVRPVATRTVSVIPGRGRPPDIPTTCCQSGCANCVWIIYAEQMKKYYSDGGTKAREAIMQIEDPNLRCFLLLEIK